MSQFARVFFVFLLVSSLVIGQGNVLFGQSVGGEKDRVFSPLPKPAARPILAALPSPQAAGNKSGPNVGLWVGLGLSVTGAALIAKKEPVHQTVCITYGACPEPGIVHMSGGLMLGLGVPLTVLKLVKR